MILFCIKQLLTLFFLWIGLPGLQADVTIPKDSHNLLATYLHQHAQTLQRLTSIFRKHKHIDWEESLLETSELGRIKSQTNDPVENCAGIMKPCMEACHVEFKHCFQTYEYTLSHTRTARTARLLTNGMPDIDDFVALFKINF